MEKHKCIRCGECCVNAPCFFIAMGKEVYITIKGKRIHDCPNLINNTDGTTSCSIIAKNPSSYTDGYCTNSKKKW